MQKIIATFVLFAAPLAGAKAPFDRKVESKHFVVSYRSDETTLPEVQNVIKLSENGYAKVVSYLGEERSPKKLAVFLEGDAYDLDAKEFRYPNVNRQGEIRLYRFPGEQSAYSEGMPHELVHAFRTLTWSAKKTHDYMTGFGFVEEGFAEHVASLVAPDAVGFVRYGFPLEVVVGMLITDNKEIPLEVLFDHHEINPKCIAQAYPLRASFFRFLETKFGKAKVLKLAYYEADFSKKVFVEIFNMTFQSLVVEWRRYALRAYLAIPNGPQLKNAYWEKSPVKHFPFCKSGADW